MKKSLLTLLTIAAMAFGAMAQAQEKTAKISIGADFALPIGDISNTYKLGIGGSLKGEFQTARSLFFTGTAGYLAFSYKTEIKNLLKEFGEDTKSVGIIPVMAGAKYYFGNIFYGEAAAGAVIGTGDNASTAFSYAPSLGATLPLNDRSSIDLGLRYQAWSKDAYTSSFLGLRAAWVFGL